MPLLVRLAVADFWDRVRRPAYAVVLLAAVGLGYLATPAKEAGWVVMQVGDYRGTYNSAYVGMVVALAGAVWLSLGGFYLVRNAISRDESTGVGRLLAATPLSNTAYLASKFLSSVLVLASMLGVLAVTAVVMQVARGETSAIDPVGLLTPFVLIALPLMAFTAAVALLFEAIPVLRAGLGNVLWFFLWACIAIGGQSPNAPLGGIGVHGVVRSLGDSMKAQGIDPSRAGEFSLGLTLVSKPLKTFDWAGFDPSAEYLLTRCVLLLIAAAPALMPALWFPRFDPARGRTLQAPSVRSADNLAGGESTLPAMPDAVMEEGQGSVRPGSFGHAPRTQVELGNTAVRLLVGEVRILLQGIPLWWWAGVLTLTAVSQLVTPATGVTRVLLPLAWIWPVLIWSRLGTQRHEHGVEAILAAYPAAHRRVLAEWGAGLLLTAVTGLGPALRMLAGSDGPGLLHWFLGALFIPSFALVLGSLSRTHRLFQAAYLPLWYGTVNGITPLDFMGALRDPDGLPAGMSPALLIGGTAVMLAMVFAASGVRRAAN
ncbi:ABC transporter permease [Streptomyces glebosus]|uniref:ABC transporter permease n=1 Tax=Streptomyces glebosus TaxID=249580 RepID=A0A640T6Y6_9ACTN|nr:ABC-2 transporter permease [Streptomyces glebosus]GFE18930.1 ABC transporter permease [Streptomyces glebosus]GHG48945.1 ABC transporter permease [Streptomyces glebosus]